MMCSVYHDDMKAFKTFYRTFLWITRILMKVLTYMLDCVMPPFEDVRKLESMSIEIFIKTLDSEIYTYNKNNTAQNAQKQLPNLNLDSHDSLIALFPYRTHHTKTAIIEIKTHMNIKVVKLLAYAIYTKSKLFRESCHEFSSNEIFSHIPLLLPIPMTAKQRRKRGWNQCELVCKELELLMKTQSKETVFQYEKNILKRIRETKDQVGMNKKERIENMKGSFIIKNPALIKGRDVIILDDVITTGSTLKEAYRTVKNAGARKVILFSISY